MVPPQRKSQRSPHFPRNVEKNRSQFLETLKRYQIIEFLQTVYALYAPSL